MPQTDFMLLTKNIETLDMEQKVELIAYLLNSILQNSPIKEKTKDNNSLLSLRGMLKDFDSDEKTKNDYLCRRYEL